jgi:hypothetical protein
MLAPAVNVLAALATAQRASDLVRQKLKGLLASDNRHGDLQVALSATRRLGEALSILIDGEEAS